jgi:hypothetical protein
VRRGAAGIASTRTAAELWRRAPTESPYSRPGSHLLHSGFTVHSGSRDLTGPLCQRCRPLQRRRFCPITGTALRRPGRTGRCFGAGKSL